MNKKVKKAFKLLSVLILGLSILTGCKEKGLNADRGTDYKYDFIDLIDVKLYGSEGNGFIEVRQKDLSVDDFESEEDYIAIRKAMDSLVFYVGPNSKEMTYLDVSPNSYLKNGDIVTLYIKNNWKGSLNGLSLNLENYSFEISNLQEPEILDLFNENIVMFYGLSGTNKVYSHKLANDVITADIMDNLVYNITPNSNTLEEGKTILTVNTELSKEYLESGDNPAFTTYIYLGRQGVGAPQSTEKVLNYVATPLDHSRVNQTKLAQVILNYLNDDFVNVNGKEYTSDFIATVQQSNAQSSQDPYTYTVTFSGTNGSDKNCLSIVLKIAEIDGEYYIAEKMGSYQHTNSNHCSSTISGYSMIVNYNNPVSFGESSENESSLIEQPEDTSGVTVTEGEIEN